MVDHLEYKIVRAACDTDFMQTDLIVLYMLEGEMNVRYYGDVIRMKKEDILLINSGMEYGISGAIDAIYGTASFSIGVISQVMDKKSLMLYVDSIRDPVHSYQDLRDILQEMTVEYIMHTHKSRAAMDSLMMRLLDCLIENYQINQGQIEADEDDSDSRMRQMMQYIINHIQDDISLSDLANEMFVSTSTLSRIFKKSTGIYFADYVMRLRVRTALGLLRNSEQNLTQIAMNCGFSTSAAFNRSFKKVTGMMPSEYRKKYQISADSEQVDEKNEQEIREELRRKGHQYSRQARREEVELNLRTLNPVPYKKVWMECINIGSIYELSRANTQFHVLRIQEQLHCKYVRVWNVFSEKVMVSDGNTYGQYNFGTINQVLDFIVTHHMKPFLDLGRRPDTAIRSLGNEVYFNEEYVDFTSRRIWEDLTRTFLREIIDRYGMEEVSTWIFELSRDFQHEGPGIYRDECYDFFNVWKYVHKEIHDLIPGAMFGGISSAIEKDREYTEDFLKRCRREHCLPDFISFFLYSARIRHMLKSDDYFRMQTYGLTPEQDCIYRIWQLLRESGLEDRKLFITEWNNSIANRNFLNDSCFRAAYLTSVAIDLWGETDLMSIMAGTDWVSSYIDSNRILNGGVGILARDTIGKPAFYALAFLGHMGTQFLSKGAHYLLTRKGNGNLYLLCHNFSWYRQNASMEYDEIDLDKIKTIRYEDERELELRISLRGMAKSGEYTIKKRSLNRQSGSILDEWGKLGYESRLNREDIKYLQAISVPRIEMERVNLSGERDLELEVDLQPMEVVLIHIYSN